MAKERGIGRKFLVVDITIQGLVQTENELRHAAGFLLEKVLRGACGRGHAELVLHTPAWRQDAAALGCNQRPGKWSDQRRQAFRLIVRKPMTDIRYHLVAEAWVDVLQFACRFERN